jgi:dipeptidyl aminopeptidase/acylaminoacyl peptidase
VGNEYPIHLLAERGLCVLSVDRPENRLAYAQLDHPEAMRLLHHDGRDHKSVLTALEAAVEQLTERGWIDPKRVGISGLSDGADKGTYAISHSTKIHFAAAAVSGAGNDPVIHYYGGPQYRDKDSLRIGDPFGDAQAAWRELSPMLNASRIEAPLLIQASDFEYSLAVPLFLTLKEAGKPVELIVYPQERHLKTQPVHRLRVYQRNVDWFGFWLSGREDPDPDKREQYLRWRALRAPMSD